LGAGECSARCLDGWLGARWRLPRSGESLPTSSFGGEMRGAVPRRAEGPLSQLLGVDPRVWRRGRPILGRGCGCSPATAMRLCRLTGADPRSGVRGQRRAVVQPPRRSYPQALLGRGELWVRTLDDSLTTPAVRV
jgi:hypothetical protein